MSPSIDFNNAIIIQAAAEVVEVLPARDFLEQQESAFITVQASDSTLPPAKEIYTGKDLERFWPAIVQATHPERGLPFAQQYFSSVRIQPPIDLDRFLVVKCRAVSSLERHGPNINGDAFPSDELRDNHSTLVFKGYYMEHASYDPRNAKGINIHATFLPWDATVGDGDFVTTISLVDKFMYPTEGTVIRDGLKSKHAGVSIGCIAGTAQCSICGQIARHRLEICAHMDRRSPLCVKGKRRSNGEFVGYDICRNLTFYELSFTKNPADRDALAKYVQGHDLSELPVRVMAEDIVKRETPGAPPVQTPKPPVKEPAKKGEELLAGEPQTLDRMVDQQFDAMTRQRLQKFVKDQLELNVGPKLRERMTELKPSVRELVQDKKQQVEMALK